MQASAVESEPESQREVIITRVYDAPARLLFEAYSKPRAHHAVVRPEGLAGNAVRDGFSRRRQVPLRHDRAERQAEHAVRRRVPARSSRTGRSSTTTASRPRVPAAWSSPSPSTKARTARRRSPSTRCSSRIAMRNSHVSRGFEQGTNSGLDQLGDAGGGDGRPQAGIKKDRERGFRSRSRCLVARPISG